MVKLYRFSTDSKDVLYIIDETNKVIDIRCVEKDDTENSVIEIVKQYKEICVNKTHDKTYYEKLSKLSCNEIEILKNTQILHPDFTFQEEVANKNLTETKKIIKAREIVLNHVKYNHKLLRFIYSEVTVFYDPDDIRYIYVCPGQLCYKVPAVSIMMKKTGERKGRGKFLYFNLPPIEKVKKISFEDIKKHKDDEEALKKLFEI